MAFVPSKCADLTATFVCIKCSLPYKDHNKCAHPCTETKVCCNICKNNRGILRSSAKKHMEGEIHRGICKNILFNRIENVNAKKKENTQLLGSNNVISSDSQHESVNSSQNILPSNIP